MRKYFLIVLFVLVVFTVVATGSFRSYIESFKGQVATINQSDEDVKVGLNLELTGPLEAYGTEQANGALLAFEQINQNGGINGMKIVPFKVDNQSDPARSAFLANQLMTQEGVSAVIGPATSNNFIAAIPMAMANRIPTVSATATAVTDQIGRVYDYIFSIIFSDSLQGKVMADFASNNLGAKRAIIIRQLNSTFSNVLAENFNRTFKNNGGEIMDLINYTSNNIDFESILSRINREDYDVIYMPGYYGDAGPFIKKAREAGITKPILGGDAYDSSNLLKLAGASALNNVYFTSGFTPLDESPLVQNFIADYKAKYGKEPNAFSALGYDAAKFVADAIKRAGSANPEAIRDAMASTINFTGVTGTFSMGEDHNPIKPVYVIELENGVPSKSITIEPTK